MVMSYDTYLRVTATQRLIDVTHHEGTIYQSEAYRRCGKGLTEAQFDEVVQGLVKDADPWLTVKEGTLGAKVLIYLDPWGDNVRQYEERRP